MALSNTFSIRTGTRNKYRNQYKGFLITINPNVIMDPSNPDFKDFTLYLQSKIKQLYTMDNAKKYLNQRGEVEFNQIKINTDTVLEFGDVTNKLHFHTKYILNFPVERGVKNDKSVGIDYKAFTEVVKQVFNEEEFKSIKVLIRTLNMTDVNIAEYFSKNI